MNTPDPRLMQRFSTEDVYQQKLAGGLPLSMALLMATANVGRGQSNEEDQRKLFLQAHAMNARLREARALRMLPVEEKLRHSMVPIVLPAQRVNEETGPNLDSDLHGLDIGPGSSGRSIPVGWDEGMVRMASVAGHVFAHVDLNSIDFDLEKSAGIFSTLAGGMKPILSGAGKGIGNLATRATDRIADAGVRLQQNVANKAFSANKAITNAGMKIQDNFSRASSAVKRSPGSIKRWGEGVGSKLEAWGAGVKPPKTPALGAPTSGTPASGTPYRTPAPAPAAAPTAPATGNTARTPAPKPDAPTEPTGGSTQGPKPPPAAQAAGQPRQPVGQDAPASQPQTPAAQVAGTTSSPQTAAAAASGGGNSITGTIGKAWDRTGLSNGRLLPKLGLLAGGAALTYGAYRAAKGVSNVFNRESEPYQYNAGGANPVQNVNEYGVAAN
jgi:hypothetical protein